MFRKITLHATLKCILRYSHTAGSEKVMTINYLKQSLFLNRVLGIPGCVLWVNFELLSLLPSPLTSRGGVHTSVTTMAGSHVGGKRTQGFGHAKRTFHQPRHIPEPLYVQFKVVKLCLSTEWGKARTSHQMEPMFPN